MEYLGGGSALDLMKAGKFEESHIQIILREVLKGLDYLHHEMKLHRDIKGINDKTIQYTVAKHNFGGEVKISDCVKSQIIIVLFSNSCKRVTK